MNGKLFLIPAALGLVLTACGKSDKKTHKVDEPGPSVISTDGNIAKGHKAKDEVHLVISDFNAKCTELMASYNASGLGQSLTVPYYDWQGNSRESKLITLMPEDSCLANGKQAWLALQVVDSVIKVSYWLSLIEEGKLKFDSNVSNCNGEGKLAYIQKLKDANWSVDETVRAAVERMFTEQFCPSLDAAIQARIGELSQSLQVK